MDHLFSVPILWSWLSYLSVVDIDSLLNLLYITSLSGLVGSLHSFLCFQSLSGMTLVQVTNIFGDLEESNIMRSYMNDAIEDISKACLAFEVKEAAPQIAGINSLNMKIPHLSRIWVTPFLFISVAALRGLHFEIIRIYILRLCSWMRALAEQISKDETWVTVSILERNKSPYAISYLPLAFRSVVASAMDQINL